MIGGATSQASRELRRGGVTKKGVAAADEWSGVEGSGGEWKVEWKSFYQKLREKKKHPPTHLPSQPTRTPTHAHAKGISHIFGFSVLPAAGRRAPMTPFLPDTELLPLTPPARGSITDKEGPCDGARKVASMPPFSLLLSAASSSPAFSASSSSSCSCPTGTSR